MRALVPRRWASTGPSAALVLRIQGLKKTKSEEEFMDEKYEKYLWRACLGSQGGGSSSSPVDEEVPSLLGSRSLGLGDLVV